MKYCTQCGTQVEDDAKFCPSCGHRFADQPESVAASLKSDNNAQETRSNKGKRDNSMCQVGFVFCVISCVLWGFALIPLIWMIPLTVMVYNAIKENKPIGVGLKVVVLLFVSLIGGILLLVGDDFEL